MLTFPNEEGMRKKAKTRAQAQHHSASPHARLYGQYVRVTVTVNDTIVRAAGAGAKTTRADGPRARSGRDSATLEAAR